MEIRFNFSKKLRICQDRVSAALRLRRKAPQAHAAEVRLHETFDNQRRKGSKGIQELIVFSSKFDNEQFETLPTQMINKHAEKRLFSEGALKDMS